MTSIAGAENTPNRVLDIQEYKTKSGITIWHVEDHSLPIITINFAFRGVGSSMDPDGKTGLGHLVSNTIDEGAGMRDANQFQEALQDHAIDLSFSSSRDHFSGKLKTLKRHDVLAFGLLRDAIHAPKFDDEAVIRMRHANIMRIKSSAAKPGWLASRLMNDVYFDSHVYTKNSGGTISGLSAIDSADMKAFVKINFTRDRLIVGTAGDVSAEEIIKIIDDIFGDLPAGDDDTSIEIPMVAPPLNSIKKMFKTDSPQSVVQMLWHSTIDKSDPDYHAYSVFNHVLGGGGFSSFLMDEIREKKGLTYGIYSHPVFMKHANYLTIESSTSPENIEPMKKAVDEILTNLKTNLIPEEMLNDAKNYLIGVLPLRFSSTLSLSGTALRMQVDGRDINSLDQWSSKISAVTAEDIKRVANRLLENIGPSAMVIVGALPKNDKFEEVSVIQGIE